MCELLHTFCHLPHRGREEKAFEKSSVPPLLVRTTLQQTRKTPKLLRETFMRLTDGGLYFSSRDSYHSFMRTNVFLHEEQFDENLLRK